MHRFVCNFAEKRSPFCVPFDLVRTVLRADANIVYRFTCRIEKVSTILRATL